MHIKSIKLEGVKLFENVSFDFSTENGSLAGFHVIVGGNGSGKSTVLKAIALAIAGPAAGLQLLQRTEGWISHQVKREPLEQWLLRPIEDIKDGRRRRERSGQIAAKVIQCAEFDQVKGGGRPLKGPLDAIVKWSETAGMKGPPVFRSGLESKTNKLAFAERGLWNPAVDGWFAAGYGPMRRLTGSSPDAMRDAVRGGRISDFVSLFREDAALSESEEWLKALQFKALEKDEVSKSFLKSILEFLNDGFLPGGSRIDEVSSEGVTVVDPRGVRIPMRDMSDGCRSAYALILDVLFRMASAYGTPDLFERQDNDIVRIVAKYPGVVLIDEVESHLHPAWQQSLPAWLVERFPAVQFVVTTHSPLILQGAVNGTIHALPLPGEETRKPRKLEGDERRRILLGKAEKVLLGIAFGLKETRSRWAINRIEEHRILEAKSEAGVRLSTEERRRLKELTNDAELAFEDFLRAEAP